MRTKELKLKGLVVAVFTETDNRKYKFACLSGTSSPLTYTSPEFDSEAEAMEAYRDFIDNKEVFSEIRGQLDLYKSPHLVRGESIVLFHRIKWYFDVPNEDQSESLLHLLLTEAERKAKKDLNNGYTCGELCLSVDDHEYRGSWIMKTN